MKTVEEYFDYLNDYIDNLSDEELLKLLEKSGLNNSNIYNDEYYDFEIVDPSLLIPQQTELNFEITSNSNINYSNSSIYVFDNKFEANINYNLRVA